MFDLVNGYKPRDWNDLVAELVTSVNAQFGTSYTALDIVGTNIYKYFYGGLQLILQAEQAISALSMDLTNYITAQNQKLILPKCTTDGFIQAISDELGIEISLRPVVDDYAAFTTDVQNYLASVGVSDAATATTQIKTFVSMYLGAGRLGVAANLDATEDDYTDKKTALLQACHDYLSAGLAYSGTEQGTIAAINGQSFAYAFNLPSVVVLDINITLTISRSYRGRILNDQEIIALFKSNFAARYKFGADFEGERYLEINELNYLGNIAVAWSVQGSGVPFTQAVRQNNYDTLIQLGDITVIS